MPKRRRKRYLKDRRPFLGLLIILVVVLSIVAGYMLVGTTAAAGPPLGPGMTSSDSQS